MGRPLALDLYCCGGGASMGLYRAGFNVLGVDKELQPHYPFPFLWEDVRDLSPSWISSFDVVWASPPCQRYTKNAKQAGTADSHPDLVGPTRDLLVAAGRPWVIENVLEAQHDLRRDLLLCGAMFDLRLVRHRIFECEGFTVAQPEHVPHRPDYVTVTGHPGGSSTRDGGIHFGTADQWREAMGIDWLPASKLREAVPPAYAEYIGKAMYAALDVEVAA